MLQNKTPRTFTNKQVFDLQTWWRITFVKQNRFGGLFFTPENFTLASRLNFSLDETEFRTRSKFWLQRLQNAFISLSVEYNDTLIEGGMIEYDNIWLKSKNKYKSYEFLGNQKYCKLWSLTTNWLKQNQQRHARGIEAAWRRSTQSPSLMWDPWKSTRLVGPSRSSIFSPW